MKRSDHKLNIIFKFDKSHVFILKGVYVEYDYDGTRDYNYKLDSMVNAMDYGFGGGCVWNTKLMVMDPDHENQKALDKVYGFEGNLQIDWSLDDGCEYTYLHRSDNKEVYTTNEIALLFGGMIIDKTEIHPELKPIIQIENKPADDIHLITVAKRFDVIEYIEYMQRISNELLSKLEVLDELKSNSILDSFDIEIPFGDIDNLLKPYLNMINTPEWENELKLIGMHFLKYKGDLNYYIKIDDECMKIFNFIITNDEYSLHVGIENRIYIDGCIYFHYYINTQKDIDEFDHDLPTEKYPMDSWENIVKSWVDTFNNITKDKPELWRTE